MAPIIAHQTQPLEILKAKELKACRMLFGSQYALPREPRPSDRRWDGPLPFSDPVENRGNGKSMCERQWFNYLVPNEQPLLNGCLVKTTIFFNVMIWNHPIETTIYKQMFQVPGTGNG